MEILRSVQADSWATVQVVDYLGALIEPARAKEEKYDGVSALSMDKPAVRLMNLHQVKGLQAPVVFLVDPTGENDFRGHPVDLHVDRDEEGTDDKVGIRGYLALSKSKGDYASETVAYTDGWKGAGGLEKREETFQVAEHLRLRYVAATRAGSALVVSVTAEDIENAARDIEAGAARPSRNPWGHFAPYLTPASGVRDISELLPYPGEETGAKARVPAAAGAGKFDPDAARERLRGRLLLMQTHDYETAAAKEWALRGTESSGEPETLFAVESLEQPQPPGEHGVEWGTIVHRLLELAPSSREELERIARDLLIEHDLDPGLAHAAAALVESVTTSDLWARSLSSSMRLVEVPFEVLLEKEAAVPTVVRGSVDLAFKEDGGWVLVDYKTDRVGRDNVQALLQKYEAQLRMYQEAWTRCTGEPVAEIGIYLVSDGRYFPL
jgi:ATP-dependent helicase/nuclease subunit A